MATTLDLNKDLQQPRRAMAAASALVLVLSRERTSHHEHELAPPGRVRRPACVRALPPIPSRARAFPRWCRYTPVGGDVLFFGGAEEDDSNPNPNP